MAMGIRHGGWCPPGRIAEDGRIPVIYRLEEHAQPGYPPRTRANVRDSDATLIISPRPLRSGTAETVRIAEAMGRPAIVVTTGPWASIRYRFRELIEWDALRVAEEIRRLQVRDLNVAGPRESRCPGIQAVAEGFLVAVLELLAELE